MDSVLLVYFLLYANDYSAAYIELIHDVCLVRTFEKSEFKDLAGCAHQLGGGFF